jgi:hypothetical protein
MSGTSPASRGRFTSLLDELAIAFQAGDEARAKVLVAQLRQVADGTRPRTEQSGQFEIVV